MGGAATWAWMAWVAFLWGLIPILDRVALAAAPGTAWQGLAIRALGVGLVAFPAVWAWGGGWAPFAALPAKAWLAYLASGFVSLLLAQHAYYLLLQQQGAAKVFPILFAAAPAVTVLLGLGLLGEALSWKQALGLALVVAGSLCFL